MNKMYILLGCGASLFLIAFLIIHAIYIKIVWMFGALSMIGYALRALSKPFTHHS